MRTILAIGLFGAILAGVSSLLLGSMVRLLSLSPIVYFAAMAGVLFPSIMVASGMLAAWTSERPLKDHLSMWSLICRPMAAGMATALGGSLLWLATFSIAGESVLSAALSGAISPTPILWLKLLILMAAYIALSIIGGVLYSIVAPDDACPR